MVIAPVQARYVPRSDAPVKRRSRDGVYRSTVRPTVIGSHSMSRCASRRTRRVGWLSMLTGAVWNVLTVPALGHCAVGYNRVSPAKFNLP